LDVLKDLLDAKEIKHETKGGTLVLFGTDFEALAVVRKTLVTIKQQIESIVFFLALFYLVFFFSFCYLKSLNFPPKKMKI
jgi:hypothetical protein